MDKKNDVQLIRRILSGDDEAFNALVRKHQKGIHALAWRKVGDFHIAEEITQDTFLQVYKNLAQLKNPNQFSGWMYVIASRLCLKWLQKSKNTSAMHSLENTPVEEIDESSYTHHVSEQRKAEITENRHELVKKLLAKLPESERTIVTLYYLGEMTAKEIGKYLGVSVNTVKSRLRRGRKRLQEQQEELLVSETLGSIPFPAQVTERIMRQVADMKPIPPPVGKPLLPWAAFGTAVALVILLLGVSNQYLARFQKPYSFEAQSEPTIEIIDTPIILDIVAKPTVRNQIGRAAAGKSSGTGTQLSAVTTTSVTLEDSAKFSTSQWTQGSAPPGGQVRDIFATSEGTVYAVAPTGIHRLGADATAWTRINTDIPIGKSRMPMAEHGGRLYIASVDEIFTSADRGETWNTIGPRPKGDAVGLIITHEEQARSAQARSTMYLALSDEGIYRSTDGGTQWNLFNDGLANKRISTIAAVEKTVFAGTGRGLYRLDSGTWKKLPVETSRAVYSLAVSENNLYVGTGPELLGFTPREAEQIVSKSESHSIRIFHSADLGESWTEITHVDKPYSDAIPSGITVLAAGETLLALGATESRSTDDGQTWTEFGSDTNMFMVSRLPAVAVNERTFYKTGPFGIFRTTDGGKSWHLFVNGMVGTRLKDLVVSNNRLYAHTGYEVYQSTEEGVSWKQLVIEGAFEVEYTMFESLKQDKVRVYTSFDSKLVVDDNRLYFLARQENKLKIFHLSTDGNALSLVQGIPAFDDEALSPGSSKKGDGSITTPLVPGSVEVKTVAVSSDVFYVEYKRGLFKWRLGDPEWINTGLIDTSHMFDSDFRNGFKVAISGETVYVGKRDGKLFQSVDEGNSWKDVTPSLPLRFTRFNEILFVGSTVYVATDTGVLASQTGEHWRVLTESTGAYTLIDRLTVDGTKVYGIGDTGIYHLDTRRQWNQISSEAPDEISALAIVSNKLYSATEDRGILHISLEGE
jgi:RNA polymerase sigma factor (sigma-70 family)